MRLATLTPARVPVIAKRSTGNYRNGDGNGNCAASETELGGERNGILHYLGLISGLARCSAADPETRLSPGGRPMFRSAAPE